MFRRQLKTGEAIRYRGYLIAPPAGHWTFFAEGSDERHRTATDPSSAKAVIDGLIADQVDRVMAEDRPSFADAVRAFGAVLRAEAQRWVDAIYRRLPGWMVR